MNFLPPAAILASARLFSRVAVFACPVRQTRLDQPRLAERVDLADDFAFQPDIKTKKGKGRGNAARGVFQRGWRWVQAADMAMGTGP